MKIHISISLDPEESAACADNLDATLAVVEDSEGNTHSLSAARGAITVPCADRPVTITPHDYAKPEPKAETDAGAKKGKGIFSRR